MGAGLHHSDKINEAALERNIKSIKNFVQIARDNEAKEIVVVGTMALRTTKNASDFIKQVAEQCVINIEIIVRKLSGYRQIEQTLSFPER